jgi:hypothetical protein
MTPIQIKGRRWPTVVLLALAALAIGAVFGSSRTGSAATAAKPSNVNYPTIAGTAQEGQTLTAGNGTWNGTTPITYTYQWDRCDENGKNCAAISGATANTYVVSHADIGNTLVVVVVGTNSDGNDTQGSKPTAVVTASGPAPAPAPAPSSTGCPSGSGTIQIGDLSSPARLAIDQETVTPGIVTPSAKSIQVHFRITACSGRPVQGALVYATAIPYNQYSVPPEGTSGSDGTVVLTMNQESGFPAARRQQLLVVFVRARKQGEPVTAGVSSRLLVSFPVSLKG